MDLAPDAVTLLRAAQHNELQEWENDYAKFARTAMEEGFPLVNKLFENIAKAEKLHAERFGYLAELLERGELFVSNVEEQWVCLKCGFVINATAAPGRCPVCREPQGYFVRMEMMPFHRS